MSANNFKLALQGDLSQMERVAWRVVVVVCAILWGSPRPDLMGWIYNGSEFIKANKSQREAFTKYQRELTIRGALAQPYAFPTIALVGASLAGTITVGSLAALF